MPEQQEQRHAQDRADPRPYGDPDERHARVRRFATPETAALLRAHLDRVQARIDCLARNRDRLSAYLAAVQERSDR